MQKLVARTAILSALLLLAAGSASATDSRLLFKCSNQTGRAEHIAFVPVAETSEGADYTPHVMLRPGSAIWNLLARWEFSDVEPPPPAEPLVYILDGRIVEEEAYQESPPEIDNIHIVCSHAGHESLGIEPGRTLIVAFTYPVTEPLREVMLGIEKLQAEFLAANDRFARSLEELGWNAPTPAWVIEMVSDDGNSWNATGRHLLLEDRESIAVSGAR